MSVKGYNDKQDTFMLKILQRMTNFTVDPSRYAILKEKVIKTLAQKEDIRKCITIMGLLTQATTTTIRGAAASTDRLHTDIGHIYVIYQNGGSILGKCCPRT